LTIGFSNCFSNEPEKFAFGIDEHSSQLQSLSPVPIICYMMPVNEVRLDPTITSSELISKAGIPSSGHLSSTVKGKWLFKLSPIHTVFPFSGSMYALHHMNYLYYIIELMSHCCFTFKTGSMLEIINLNNIFNNFQ
jgi:hypothetical protein